MISFAAVVASLTKQLKNFQPEMSLVNANKVVAY